MNNFYWLLILFLLFSPLTLFSKDEFFKIKSAKYYQKIRGRDTVFWGDNKKAPYMKVKFSLQKTQDSKNIFTHIYYYNKSKKLISKTNLPFKIKVDKKIMDKLPTVIDSKNDIHMYFSIPLSISKKVKTAIITIGDSQGANVFIYPKGNSNDYEYPEKKLVETKNRNVTKRDSVFWGEESKKIKIPYMKVEFSLQKTQLSKNIFTHIYYYNKSKKLISKTHLPFKIKVDKKIMDKLPTVIDSKNDIEIIFPIPLSISKKVKTAIITIGDSQGANVFVYPKGNSNDYEYPEKKLVETKSATKRTIFIDPVIEHEVKTSNPRQPKIIFFLRFPVGVTDSKNLNGVLAMCLLKSSAIAIKSQLQNLNSKDDVGGLIRFAQKNKLVILCWTSSSLWNPRKNWDEQTKAENRNQDRSFANVVDAWKKGVKKIVKKYNIPSQNYLLWGVSGSAQYAARLALREPKYFTAIHIHIPSSFDIPTANAKHILWCLTTGENEIGYYRSLRFLDACQRKRYAILYKAIPNLAHSSHHQSNKIGIEFFKYALSQCKRYRNSIYSPTEVQWEIYRDFHESTYIGDILNQRIYTKENAKFISKKYKINIPSKEILNAWETK